MEYIAKAGADGGEMIRGKDYFHEYLCCWMAALMQSKTLDLLQKEATKSCEDRVSVIREMSNPSPTMLDDRRKRKYESPMQSTHLHQKISGTSVEQSVPIKQQKFCLADQQTAFMRVRVERKGEKGPYICHDCGKVLKRSSSLSNHRLIHKNVKAFKCEKCGASFLRKSDLGKHYAIHTGSKPYICNICNKSFSQSSNMLTHKRRHSGVKPYKCDYCLKSFYRKVDVKRHEIVHSISEGE